MVNNTNQQNQSPGDGSERPERRTAERRKDVDRRVQDERRFDSRLVPIDLKKTVKLWFRSLTRSRLGIDRRKRRDRRKNNDRRHQRIEPLLTPEEIADLLS